MHPSGTDNGISGGVIPLTTTSYKYALESHGHKINSIDNLIQSFEDNYGEMTGLYK